MRRASGLGGKGGQDTEPLANEARVTSLTTHDTRLSLVRHCRAPRARPTLSVHDHHRRSHRRVLRFRGAHHRGGRPRRHPLARPPRKRNALGPAFWADLPRAMAAIGSRPDVRAVVIAARGPHFSVGLDLVAMGPGRRGHPDTERRDALGGGEAPDPPGRSCASRPRSHRWPTVPCRSSPPSTATASAAGSTWPPPATSAWPAPTPSSRCGRPRWPSWPTSAACSGSPTSSARATWPSWPIPARTSTADAGRGDRTGQPGASADAEAVLADARALAAEIAANSPLAVQGTKAVLAAGEGRVGGRGSRLRGRLERRVPRLGRPGRGHDRLHGEAAGGVHRPLRRSRRSAVSALAAPPPAPLPAPASRFVFFATSARTSGADRVDDVLGLVEQLGRLLAGDVGHRPRGAARPATAVDPSHVGQPAARRRGSRRGTSRAPRARGRARRTRATSPES